MSTDPALLMRGKLGNSGFLFLSLSLSTRPNSFDGSLNPSVEMPSPIAAHAGPEGQAGVILLQTSRAFAF